VVRDGQVWLEDGGQFGGFGGVHDDLLAGLRPDPQPVGGQQRDIDVAEPVRQLPRTNA
jgi:hypothetical protein